MNSTTATTIASAPRAAAFSAMGMTTVNVRYAAAPSAMVGTTAPARSAAIPTATDWSMARTMGSAAI